MDGGDTGAGERTRTADLLITNQLLYQLSYAGVFLESATCGKHGRVLFPDRQDVPIVVRCRRGARLPLTPDALIKWA